MGERLHTEKGGIAYVQDGLLAMRQLGLPRHRGRAGQERLSRWLRRCPDRLMDELGRPVGIMLSRSPKQAAGAAGRRTIRRWSRASICQETIWTGERILDLGGHGLMDRNGASVALDRTLRWWRWWRWWRRLLLLLLLSVHALHLFSLSSFTLAQEHLFLMSLALEAVSLPDLAFPHFMLSHFTLVQLSQLSFSIHVLR